MPTRMRCLTKVDFGTFERRWWRILARMGAVTIKTVGPIDKVILQLCDNVNTRKISLNIFKFPVNILTSVIILVI